MKKNKYTIYWMNGKKETIEGFDIANAFTSAGFGSGAIGCVDFYEEGETSDWFWNTEKKQWDWTIEKRNKLMGLSVN